MYFRMYSCIQYGIYPGVSSRFFESEPNEIYSHVSEKGQKAGFFAPKISRITISREKERRKIKSEEDERRRREKSNGCTLRFIMATLESFWPKKPV